MENLLRKHAYYGDGELKVAPISDIINIDDLEKIGEGLNTRVFRIKNENWVVKEGRWDLDVNLFKNVNISLPTQVTESVLKQFKLTFLPKEEEIKRQYALYYEFAKYFGYFENESIYFHPQLRKLFATQKQIRETLVSSCQEVIDIYGLEHSDQLKNVLGSDSSKTNFLPKEYLLYGKSFSKQNKDRNTYYIFQEYVKGEPLHDIKEDGIDTKILQKVMVIAYLVLLMSVTKELVPDLRPRYIVGEGNDWFRNTDNIIIANDIVRFIDTRWMWGMKDNIVKRGLLIPEITLESTKKYLNKSLELYASNNY